VSLSSNHGQVKPTRNAPKERLLLWLWKVLPLPQRVRRAYIELTHPRFLVGVMALIEDEQGRLLIGEHTYRREFRWGLPGGYLQAREEPAVGLQREVMEETGLAVEVEELLCTGLHTRHQLDLLYRARVIDGQLQTTAEVSAWKFVPNYDLSHILPNQLTMLRRAGIVNDKRLSGSSGCSSQTP
jgi:ADP-ribose pyrophosphatase YjhB (NUDIX family)